MNKIYESYDDVHTRATLIYKKDADDHAYADSAKTIQIDAATLKNLFEKGVIIIDGTVEYKPISFSVAANVGTITYVKTDGTTPTTAVLETVISI